MQQIGFKTEKAVNRILTNVFQCVLESKDPNVVTEMKESVSQKTKDLIIKEIQSHETKENKDIHLTKLEDVLSTREVKKLYQAILKQIRQFSVFQAIAVSHS